MQKRCSICREHGHNKRTCEYKIVIEHKNYYMLSKTNDDEHLLKKKEKWYKRIYYKFKSLF